MNREIYERECLVRGPKFRRDLQKLSQEHPRLFDQDLWPKDDQGHASPLWTHEEQEALKIHRAKYPSLSFEHVSMVLQPAPLVFDPAWKLCVDRAAVDFLRRRGQPPTGLVTRAGVDSGADLEPDTEKIYKTAGGFFAEMDEELRAGFRRSYGPTIFERARIFLPIGADTTLEQVKRLWAPIRQAQRACYGSTKGGRAPRRNIFEERLLAYDLIRGGGLTVKEAARRAGKHPRTFLNRYNEALSDIEGFTGKLGCEDYDHHIAICSICQKAETSDGYCLWMQRQLGPRSGWVKGAKALPEIEEAREAGRGRAGRRRKA